MFLYLVVALSLGWPRATGTENAGLLDQVVANGSPGQEQDELRDQVLAPVTSSVARYEHSNGFLPTVPSASPTPTEPLEERRIPPYRTDTADNLAAIDTPGSAEDPGAFVNAETEAEGDEAETENDPAYSAEARMFLSMAGSSGNRRSFEHRPPRNDFEFLKVKNDTPAVANYPDLYEGAVNSDEDHPGPAGHRSRETGQSVRDTAAFVSPSTSQNHRFSRPVVVAEPSYEYEHAFAATDPAGDDYHRASAGVIDTVSPEPSHRHAIKDRNGRFRSDEDSRDVADAGDYSDYPERPRKAQKSRRLPKEHRGSPSDDARSERPGNRHRSPRTKTRHRGRATGNSWSADGDRQRHRGNSYEDAWYDDGSEGKRAKNSKKNAASGAGSDNWNQVSPNLEISHSSGVEIGQLEKPKMIVNLLPLTNFDHATAIGNSQGFQVSDAVLQNLVSATPNPRATATTPVPGVILGQSSLQNSAQPVYPGTIEQQQQQKFLSNLKARFVSGTMSPIYAVTPSQQVHAAATTLRPTFAGASNRLPQLLVPQPTVHSVPTLLQTPLPSSDYVQVHSHGMHGQSPAGYGTYHGQPFATLSTIASTPRELPVASDTQGTNFLASASLAVGRQTSNGEETGKSSSAKTYVHTAHLLPAVLHPVPTLATVSATTPQVSPEQQSVHGTRLFLQPQRPLFAQIHQVGVHQGVPSTRTADSAAMHSIAGNVASQIVEDPHLPRVATRNVEIVNPGIKASYPMDTAILDPYGAMQYPAAVLTTPIPVFTTASFVSSATEPANGDAGAYRSRDRPLYDPINFVPNTDLLKQQHALNGKLQAGESLQENLNLVPLIPGGSFFRPSFAGHSELSVKPKLAADLQTYAEQMFKESLKTIHSSQKWNNDRKTSNGNTGQNISDALYIRKLENELQRLKASLSDARRNKEQIEGHQSETKVQTAEFPSNEPDKLLAALQQVLKDRPIDDSSHASYEHNKSARYRRPGGDVAHGEPRDPKRVKDFLAAPQSSSHRAKERFPDKPGKKRPGPPRYSNQDHHRHHRNRHYPQHRSNHRHGPRPHPRSNLSPKVGGIETSPSNVNPLRVDGFSRYTDGPDYPVPRGKASPFEAYSGFLASLLGDRGPDAKGSRNHRDPEDAEDAYSHPKMHNLLGLLMKNKQLPNGRGVPTNYRDDGQQFRDDSLTEYLSGMSAGAVHSDAGQMGFDGWRALPRTLSTKSVSR